MSTNLAIAQKDTSKHKTPEVDLYKNACKLMDSSKYKEAIVIFKNAIKLKPDYIEALNKMAQSKIKLKDFKGAEKDLKTAF